MKLIVMLNREVPLGNVMNGLGHMTFGLGHRFAGAPSVNVIFGTSEQVRAFRTVAAKLHAANPEETVFNDFIDKMVGPDSAQLIIDCKAVPEQHLTYFGCCFAAQEIDPQLVEATKECQQLRGYTPHLGDAATSLQPAPARYADSTESTIDGMKISMLVGGAKGAFAQTINSLVLASLAAGSKPDPVQKRFMPFVDADGGEHRYISFHPFPVVKPAKPTNHLGIAKAADAAESAGKVMTNSQYDGKGEPLATVIFGKREEVEAVFTKDLTTLFRSELKPADLEAFGFLAWFSAKEVASAVKQPGAAAPLFFAARADAVAEIAKIQDDLSTKARTINKDELVQKLTAGLERIGELVHILPVAQQYDTMVEAITETISKVLSEAAGGGKLDSVQYLIAEYASNITAEDLAHCRGYAEHNGHQAVVDFFAATQRSRQESTADLALR